jgi:hypothetical protein
MDPDLRAEIAAACREHDRMMAEGQYSAAAPPVRKEAGQGELLFRVTETALAPAVAAGVMDAETQKGWDSWIAAHQANLKTEIYEALGKGMAEFVSEYLHQKLQPLRTGFAETQAELVEVKGLLTSALTALDEARKTAEALQQDRAAEKRERAIRDETIRERSARIADLQRDNAASHAELARAQLAQAFGRCDQRFELLEEKIAMLLRLMSLSGVDLPRGL